MSPTPLPAASWHDTLVLQCVTIHNVQTVLRSQFAFYWCNTRNNPQIFNQRIPCYSWHKTIWILWHTNSWLLNKQHWREEFVVLGLSEKYREWVIRVTRGYSLYTARQKNWTNIATLFSRNASPYMRSHLTILHLSTSLPLSIFIILLQTFH